MESSQPRSVTRCFRAKGNAGKCNGDRSTKIYTYVAVIGITCFIVICVAVVAIALSVKAYGSQEGTTSRTEEFHTKDEEIEPQLEHIEVVGDGTRFLILEEKARLRHLKLSTKTGQLRLKHHSYIIIKVPGLYRIYGQYAVFQPRENRTESITVNVSLIQNKLELCKSVVHHCRRVCTKAFSKTARLTAGDKLWLRSGTGGVFMVHEKYYYFGVNLLKRDAVV